MPRKPKNEGNAQKAFLARVARMYYTLGMSQQEIANQLSIGRSSVGRFLSEARDQGVVQIHIGYNAANVRRSDLEEALIMNYGLKEAVVYRGDPGVGFDLQAAKYLDSLLPFDGHLGVTGGQILLSVGQQLHECEARPGLNIVQLSGNADNVPSTAVIQTWSQNLEAVPIYVHAPGLVSDPHAREVVRGLDTVKESRKAIEHLEVGVYAIGLPSDDAAILRTGLVPGLSQALLGAESVGDVGYHFFNEQGEFSLPEISSMVIGATSEDLMKVPTRVGIAYGKEKAEAIRVAIKYGIVNVLLTDESTAELI